MKILSYLIPLCLILLLGALKLPAQNLYFQSVNSIATEVRIINESTNAIRCQIPNFVDPEISSTDYLTYAFVSGEPNLNYFAESGVHYTTTASQTNSIYPTLLYIMSELTDESHTLVRLADLLGVADQLWWSVRFFKEDEYGNPGALDGIGFEDLSYTDGSGGIHIVYRFYDLEE